MDSKKVVIIGGGFGGLLAAQELKDSEYEIIIIDRTNHHVFSKVGMAGTCSNNEKIKIDFHIY